MDAIRALGINVPEGRMPRVHLSPVESDLGLDRLESLGLEGPVLALGLGASRPTKTWPLERFAALAIEWRKKQKGGVLALVGPREDDVLHSFLKAADDLLAATVPDSTERATIRLGMVTQGAPPIRLLAAMLRHCSVFVGNDSGPKHLAVSVDIPTVTIFGPEDPFEWHPYPKSEHPILYVAHLNCRKDAQPGMPAWCGLDVCIEEKHRCMREIGFEAVLAEALRVAR